MMILILNTYLDLYTNGPVKPILSKFLSASEYIESSLNFMVSTYNVKGLFLNIKRNCKYYNIFKKCIPKFKSIFIFFLFHKRIILNS